MTSVLKQNKKICIVGSGLVGSLLAILLAKAGFEVDVYEKRKDPRKDAKTRGRSIALSLSDRGWKALQQVGLDQLIRTKTNPAYGRIVHQKDGTVQAQNYGDGTQAIWTVNRHYLNTILLERAIATGLATFFFDYACEDINEKTGEITFNVNDRKRVKKQYQHIIGVDGIFSAIRKNLSEKGLWAFKNHRLDFGYKELCIPSNAKGKHVLDAHRTHVWPRKNSVLIGFPTKEGDFVSTLFLPLVGKDSLESITTPEMMTSFFEREYKEVLPLMPKLEKDFLRNPASTITQVKGGPWHYEDKVLLMGDACHAVTPFYGMGMNIGFEDCTVFMEMLRENNYDFGKTFKELGEVRKPNTDAMTELSYKNFKSISESPDPAYQTKWLLERRIWKLLPKLWTPTYVLIAFSDTPLGEVPYIKEKQDRIIHDLVKTNPNVLRLTDGQLKTIIETSLRKSGLHRRQVVSGNGLYAKGNFFKRYILKALFIFSTK